MTVGEHQQRTLDYCVLRTCERLGMAEREFVSLPYDEQLRLLAYGWLRIDEERVGTESER